MGFERLELCCHDSATSHQIHDSTLEVRVEEVDLEKDRVSDMVSVKGYSFDWYDRCHVLRLAKILRRVECDRGSVIQTGAQLQDVTLD